MAYSRPTFEIQGVTFKLKPTSPRNVKELSDYIEESDIQGPEDEEEVDEDRDFIQETADEWMEILQLIAEPQDGTFEDVDPMNIDINKVDYYLSDFMPVASET